MKIQKTPGQIFLALVPHRDVRLQLRKYSASLFKEGFDGAFHFPWVAPLASISVPLNMEELKHCADAVRQTSGDKFICENAASLPFHENTLLFGPRLVPGCEGCMALSREALGSDKIGSLFSQSVIGSLLVPANADWAAVPPPPKLSFRAAAVANFFWQPLRAKTESTDIELTGFKWKIGRLCWLPKA